MINMLITDNSESIKRFTIFINLLDIMLFIFLNMTLLQKLYLQLLLMLICKEKNKNVFEQAFLKLIFHYKYEFISFTQ